MKKFLILSSTALAVICLLFNSCCPGQGPAGTRTQALEDSLWDCSEWISAADAPVVEGLIVSGNERAADGASWFAASYRNSAKVKKATWMTSGLGVYQLYVNGRPIGTEVLKPGFTHYAKTKYSYTYDVTDALDAKKGASNQFSAQLTPGWWGDKIITPSRHEGMIGRKTAFRAVLKIEYEDGTSELYGTNCDDWKAGVAGKVKHAAIFDGEEYDDREPMGYEAAATFSRPEPNTEFEGKIFPSEGAEIYHRDDLALEVKSAYIWEGVSGSSEQEFGKVIIKKNFDKGGKMTIKPGETLVVDFGQNAAAVPEFVFKAAEGTTLTFLPGELLNDGNGARSRGMDGPEGSVHRENLRTPDSAMLLRYTFGEDKAYTTYRPLCTFFGYRYASITADSEVEIKSLRSIPVSSITAEMETGSLECGNELINQLISNTLWGQRSNYLSVTTDCPQRNERLGWTADTQVFAETGSYFANTDSFFHKWMRDMRDTQSELGGFPGVAPMAQYGAVPTNMMRVGWADAGVIVPWVVWKQFDDKAIIDDNWEAMEKFMDHVAATKYDHAALKAENGDYQWGDWLSYEPLESRDGKIRDEKGKVLPDAEEYWSYLGASYWAMDAAMMAEMAKVSGRDESKYTQMARDAKDYIRSRFLDSDCNFKTQVLNTMQTPALFLLKNGIVQGEAKDRIIARLRENFREHDNCLQTGFLGTSILMPTLSENGMSDIAYELLFQRKNPSWLYSVDNGATTMWERWNSYMKDKGMGPKGMNSFNHYAYGCVCEWMWKTMAGIASDSADPGFKHIIMKPVPDRRLGYVRASYKSAAGLIESYWRYEGDKWIWEFSIPKGAKASVSLPDGSPVKEYGEGRHSVELSL